MENQRWSLPLTILGLSLLSLHITGVTSASIEIERNRLDIYPSADVQTKKIGSSIVLTCKPKVENLKLITNMEWIDPQNRVVESRSHAIEGQINPSMYTEYQSGSLKLFFNSLKEDEAGTYICRANYANSLISRTVSIEAFVAITWEDAPLEQYPIQGEDFAIKCRVKANPAPTIDWLYNNEVVRTNDHYIIEPFALKIKNVQETDDGIYTCRAFVEQTGEFELRPIRVEVHRKPLIEEFEGPVEVIEGETASIECKGTGKPPPKFSWTKLLTQEDLSKTARFGVNEVTGFLSINHVERDDEGEYQCVAENAAGRVTMPLQINVIVKPKVSEFVNVTTPQEHETTIICKAFGRPPPQITFRKHVSDRPYDQGRQSDDDRIVLTNTADDNNGITTGVLKIDKALRYDDGLYECIASNKGGKAYKNGHLTVEFPPTFEAMTNKTMWSWDRRPVNLTCIAESIPNATIQWFHYGNLPVESDPQLKVYNDGPRSVLNVLPLDRKHYTNYKCVATNKLGKAYKDIELREAYPPLQVSQAKIKDVTATSFQFDVIPPVEEPDLPILSIVIEYKEQQMPWSQARNRTFSPNSIYIIENLKPQTTYEFRFAATNEVGRGPWGLNLAESTQTKSAPSPPKFRYDLDKDGVARSGYNDKFELRWLEANANGEPIEYYFVEYCQLHRYSGEWQIESSSCRDGKVYRGISYWIKDLIPNTFYQARVHAHNLMGDGSPSKMIFKTEKGNARSLPHQGPLVSSGAIIGIVVSLLIALLVLIDAALCCTIKSGIIYYLYERSQKKPVDEEDSKLRRDEKEPLKDEKKITPIIDSGLAKETSVTFDGKRSISKTGFAGKDSAV